LGAFARDTLWCRASHQNSNELMVVRDPKPKALHPCVSAQICRCLRTRHHDPSKRCIVDNVVKFDSFIRNRNIRRYQDLLLTDQFDSKQRDMISKLLAEEEAKELDEKQTSNSPGASLNRS
jgi:hypothetical protein